ncbi:MAG TPA: ferrochelatase [Planctomycetota bacterium]|nr:ferrochelatase [Planctomycetota bacterium]
MKTGVLLMAHGSPESVDQMGDYLRHVLTRKPPTPEIIREFQERYTLIGGKSPLLEIGLKQARALQEKLGVPVYVGMRHWHPFIKDVVEQAKRDGVERLIGLPLAPQYSRVSVGAYHNELEKTGIDHVHVFSWHLEPALIQYWREATAGKEFVLFTAHSIPSEGAHPYPAQLQQMVKAIAKGQHTFGYQSKSPSPIPWLGPEVPQVLVSLPRTEISVAAIGFICDHVEVLYDLDVLHRDQAEAIGLRWNRLPMPNDHPLLIEALASAAGKAL